VVRQRFALPLEVTSFQRPARTMPLLGKLVRLRHGRS
jgi:hypothetical protein